MRGKRLGCAECKLRSGGKEILTNRLVCVKDRKVGWEDFAEGEIVMLSVKTSQG